MIRPNKKQKALGRGNGWDGMALERGYDYFQDDQLIYIARIDDMMVFESDDDASEQANRDGIPTIHLTQRQYDKLIENTNESGVSYNNIVDCEENRKFLRDYKIIK